MITVPQIRAIQRIRFVARSPVYLVFAMIVLLSIGSLGFRVVDDFNLLRGDVSSPYLGSGYALHP
jgi:hypothetical protein